MALLTAAFRPLGVVAGAVRGGYASKIEGKNEKNIASVSNPFVKHCVKLRRSAAYRRATRSVLVVGLTPILEICRFQRMEGRETSKLDCLILLDGFQVPKELDDSSSTEVVHANPAVMQKVSGMQSVDSTEAAAIMSMPTNFCDLEIDQEGTNLDCLFDSPFRILVLDGIQDPGNLGTLVRTACALKWDGVFLLPGCCDPFNDKALRASRGASFQLPVLSGDWPHLTALRAKFSMKLFAAHPDHHNRCLPLTHEIASALSETPLCLVLGSEGNGLSKQAFEEAEMINIPMGGGALGSINVSVAGGIFLFMLQNYNQLQQKMDILQDTSSGEERSMYSPGLQWGRC